MKKIETYTFKKGQRCTLDSIYHLQGILDNRGLYYQEDCADDYVNEEQIFFLKDVKLTITLEYK